MTMICSQCGNEFEAKRRTALYCGDACNKRAQRVSGTELEGQKVSGTHPVSVTTTEYPAEVLNRAKRAAIGGCIPISKPMDCHACQRAGKVCEHRWFWGWPAGEHVEGYHESVCVGRA